VLAADDIWEHFEKYGPVCDFEFLTETNPTVEVVRLFFADPESRVEAMKQSKHRIIRGEDGKAIRAEVYGLRQVQRQQVMNCKTIPSVAFVALEYTLVAESDEIYPRFC